MPDSDTHSTRRLSRRSVLKTSGGLTAAGLAGLSGCLGNVTGGDSGPIVVGSTAPLSGPLASLGQEIERGYTLGVERINEAGGIDGREVELVLRDDETDPNKVRQGLTRITSENDVSMIWASVTTPLVLAGVAFSEREGLPFLPIGFAFEAGLKDQGGEWTFSPYPFSTQVAQATGRVLDLVPSSQQPSSVGIWVTDSGWGKEQGDRWESELGGDYDVVLRRNIARGGSDYSTRISEAKDAGVEVLLGNPFPGDAITMMKQMQSADYAPKLLEFVRGAHTAGWWRALGPTGAYVVGSPGWVPGQSGRGNEEFASRFVDAYEGDSAAAIGVTTGAAYNITQVAEQAMNNASELTPSGIRDALSSGSFTTVMGEFGFDDQGFPTNLDAPAGQWWDGAFRLVSPKADSELSIDLQYPMAPWGER